MRKLQGSLPQHPETIKREKKQRKKNKIKLLLLAVLLFVLLVAYQYYNAYGLPFIKDKTDIPVGILINKSDEQSDAIALGAEKAIHQVNQDGGINGNKIKIIIARSKKHKLKADYNRLKRKTNCIIYAGVDNDFLKDADTPVMMPEGAPVDNKNVLRFKYSQAEEAQAISEYFTKDQRQYEIGVLLNLDKSINKYNTFKKDYKKLNGRIEHVEAYGNLDTNFDSQFARFKRKGISVVYAPTLEKKQLKAIMTSANQNRIAIVAGNQINDYQNADLASCEGITFTNTYIADNQTNRKIKNIVGTNKRGHDAVLGYDAAKFIIACYKEGASTYINKTMHRITYHGINNKYTFDSKGNPEQIEISIVQMVKGKRKQITKFWI